MNKKALPKPSAIAKKSTGRRGFLTALGASGLTAMCLPLLNCHELEASGATTLPTQKGQCRATEDNIEGPFYCANTPSRVALASPTEPGQPIVISGRILQPDCKSPIPGAVIEIWQANEKGLYDNTCLQGKGNHKYLLRGQLKADAKGNYSYTTIFPGRYLNGPTYRPAHIHYKVHAPGYQSLTTQLYFDGDPYIKGDPFVKASLIIKMDKSKKQWRGTFDIVLKTAP